MMKIDRTPSSKDGLICAIVSKETSSSFFQLDSRMDGWTNRLTDRPLQFDLLATILDPPDDFCEEIPSFLRIEEKLVPELVTDGPTAGQLLL